MWRRSSYSFRSPSLSSNLFSQLPSPSPFQLLTCHSVPPPPSIPSLQAAQYQTPPRILQFPHPPKPSQSCSLTYQHDMLRAAASTTTPCHIHRPTMLAAVSSNPQARFFSVLHPAFITLSITTFCFYAYNPPRSRTPGIELMLLASHKIHPVYYCVIMSIRPLTSCLPVPSLLAASLRVPSRRPAHGSAHGPVQPAVLLR